jgi:hypothetical protein
MMNAPGNGESPFYVADPQILLQKWGANLRTNSVDLESALFNVNRPLSRDCLGKDEFRRYNFPSSPIQYPTTNALTTEQSRTIMPAWTARDLEQANWYFLPLNPQENTCFSFQNNISTRILEKNNYVAKIPCDLMGSVSPEPSVEGMHQRNSVSSSLEAAQQAQFFAPMNGPNRSNIKSILSIS